ncbi:hypothetical protein D3C78_1048170 [compost metagenome]
MDVVVDGKHTQRLQHGLFKRGAPVRRYIEQADPGQGAMARILANLDTETVDSDHGAEGADQGIFGFTPDQRRFERFANGSQRDAFDDMNRFGDGRPLMDMHGGMSGQFGTGHHLASTQLDVDYRQFTGVGVGSADRCCAKHCRVFEQCLLDHRRIDVVPSADDQVLGTSGEKEETASIASRQIAGL